MLLSADKSQLLIVDVQERLLPAMADGDAVVSGCRTLLEAAARLKVPTLVSEQYRNGLGPSVAAIEEKAGAARRFEKLAFSCAADERISAALVKNRGKGRDQVVIAGIEAHVCVLQSAIGLRLRGFDIAVVSDAISSRRRHSVDIALSRMAHQGIQPVTVEMVLFEWLGRAGSEDFKAFLRLIK